MYGTLDETQVNNTYEASRGKTHSTALLHHEFQEEHEARALKYDT